MRYKYRDGEIPGHTKPHFANFKVLTVHGIVALNAFQFLRKIRHFPSEIPKSVASTLSNLDSPIPGSTHITCENWLKSYDNNFYRKSVFFKGPLLFISSTNIEDSLSPVGFLTTKSYKKCVKSKLIAIQN